MSDHSAMKPLATSAERERLHASDAPDRAWRRWGPYVSDRQWGTVREDYSADGSAWDSFPHDHARSRAYRWGEDGIAGFSDDQQRLCIALALWNRVDPIIKERFFGLTNSEGNHGEDVKELYYHLDGTPTHSYMSMLYRYPHREFPYEELVRVNRGRGMHEAEHEIHDTSAFADDEFFDVEVEYAKAGPDDILMRITVHNRGTRAAALDVLPTLWFRNTWSWKPAVPKPVIEADGRAALRLRHESLGAYRAWIDGSEAVLLCENETNARRLWGADVQGPFKDGINDRIVHGDQNAAHTNGTGTKAAFHRPIEVAARSSSVVRVRLSASDLAEPFADFDKVFADRRREADEFHASLPGALADADQALVRRRALAGLLWSKQYYEFDIARWMHGDESQPAPPESRSKGRNRGWEHLNNAEVLLMPDGWEYPWYAAWDLAFHCVALAPADPQFAKEQLVLLTREWYMHPSGQLPAYEWAFGDVNPPVHAWAAWRVYEIEREQNGGKGDRDFLERIFHKLLLNFTWWVNRKDEDGRNIFQGGFLGLDNIGVFDRSAPLPTGGHIDQADGTSWMAMYSLNLLRIAMELARTNHVYEDVATKFFEHFLQIAEAMNNIGDSGASLWNEEDKFYYDVLHSHGSGSTPLRLRSMVGLIPLFAVEVIDSAMLDELPEFARRLDWYLKFRPDLAALVSRWRECGAADRRLLSLLRAKRMKAVLARMLDEKEFLSPFGVRALSKHHEASPFTLCIDNACYSVRYTPGESDSGLFGGNSNWRGPVWFPVNALIIESLRKFHSFYGDAFKIECPTGSGVMMTLAQVADELSRRLTRLFLPDASGARPALGDSSLMRTHPLFKDHPLFYEYFDGDTGRGVGASHQTGWTALVAWMLREAPAASAARPEKTLPAKAPTKPRGAKSGASARA